MVSRGASVPPEVPLPSAIHQESSFSTQRTATVVPASSAVSVSWMFS